MVKNMNIHKGIIIIFITIIFLMIQNVSAHPPSKLYISYIEENNELIVNITHSVTNDNHYIESIKIKINGEEFDNYEYTNQPSNAIISYKYNISANEDDVIEVKAICNQFGSLTRELIVGEEQDGSATPGFCGFLLICSIVLIAILFKKGKIFS